MTKHFSASKGCLILLLFIIINGCVRNDEFFGTDTSESNRQTIVKIVGAEQELVGRFRDPNPLIDTFLLLEVRRDTKDESDLNKSLTVRLVRDTGVLGRYNRAHGTQFEELPANHYSLLADIGNITFQPGEFSKEVRIRFDKTNLDLSKQYALGIKLTDAGTGAVIGKANDEAVWVIGVKNKYDGIYEISGSLVDLTNSNITGYYPLKWELRTTGASTVTVVDNELLGIPGHVISSSGSTSYYGSFGLVVTFDPATNKITSLVNYYGQPSSNGRSAALDPSGRNEYDPVTKKIYIKYFMLQPGTTVRTTFDEVWSYTGPR